MGQGPGVMKTAIFTWVGAGGFLFGGSGFLAPEVDSYEKDREAILGMVGKFEVEFNFEETVSLVEGYELRESYQEEALEWVKLVEDRGKGSLFTGLPDDLDGGATLAREVIEAHGGAFLFQTHRAVGGWCGRSWDAMVLDIGLPDENGLEFLTGLDERLSAEDLPKYRDLSDALEAELIRRLLERYDGKLARLAGALQANRATLRKRLQGAE